jgi:ubiquinone/menaquinone biosynthesis C-methylase UbiE
MSRTRAVSLASAAGVIGAALWWRRNPSACPYGQRFWVEAPHPFITRARLLETLAPRPGERILEVGPGTGYYSLAVAGALEPEGALELLDVQPEMLDHTLARAREAGVANIHGAEADARRLPFEDASFDAAYLVAVLGEIPDQGAALRELRRVLKPGGRLVVGELFGDPHMVTPRALRERGEAAGLRFVRRAGPWVGSFSLFAA